LLDAGGTLVCPNADRIVEAGRALGYPLDADRVIASFFRRAHRFDASLRARGADPGAARFLVDVITLAGVPAPAAASILDEALRLSHPHSLWTYALPGVARALDELRQAGYRMSVVSNSDGSVAQQMEDLGLAHHFERIFDSAILGVAKPDPEIFRRVLADLGLDPTDCLYAGDIVMIDVVCANACRMPAVHFDPLGLYAAWPGFRTQDLPSLTRMLLCDELDLADPRLLAFA
jgi:putative hydrolase of the HAD superfamily